MPEYRFKRDDNGSEAVFTMHVSEFRARVKRKKMTTRSKIDDSEIRWTFLKCEKGIGHLNAKRTYPLVSDRMGVNPSQIADARAADAALGIKVDYTPDGSVIFPDRSTRKRYCESHGIRDNNAGYSDPQGANDAFVEAVQAAQAEQEFL